MDDSNLGDSIADIVLRNFASWEKKRKPLTRTNGVREWVPLSGIVGLGKNGLVCLSAATGMKCLPQKSIPLANGVVLHDWHAEILAIRSFNRFLLEECFALAAEGVDSEWVRFNGAESTGTEGTGEEVDQYCQQPFRLREGIRLFMYCSEAPCGDASMELTIASQEDSTPWSIPNTSTPLGLSHDSEAPAKETEAPLIQPALHGRGYFSALGIVRRKPSRPDAPPTLSKSCTDKLSLKQSTSLLSSLTSLLISPEDVYFDTLVLPSSQLSSTAVTRAFSSSGRLAPLVGRKWNGEYQFRPFKVFATYKEFEFSRRQTGSVVPSNISSSWTPRGSETLIGGSLQGRRQFDVKGASKLCRKRMWKLALEVAVLSGSPIVERCLRMGSYAEVKGVDILEERRKVKRDVGQVLGGWVKNEGGDEFDVEGVEI